MALLNYEARIMMARPKKDLLYVYNFVRPKMNFPNFTD